jgi:hypothetical protein
MNVHVKASIIIQTYLFFPTSALWLCVIVSMTAAALWLMQKIYALSTGRGQAIEKVALKKKTIPVVPDPQHWKGAILFQTERMEWKIRGW